MSDLHTRFRSLDELSVPDLWREAEARAQAVDIGTVRTRPWGLIAVTLLLLMLAIGGAALIGSGVIKPPVLLETSSMLPSPTNSAKPEPASGRIVFGRYDRFVGDYVVYLIDPNGTNENQLLPGGHEAPRWSPDGKDIAMTSAGIFVNAGEPGGSFREFSTFDGVRYLPDPTLNLGCTLWTPDGSRLACEGWDSSDPTRNGIYTVDAVDASDLQRLTSSPDGAHDIPGDYSADGSRLFFSRVDHHVGGPLMVVGMDGSDPHELASGPFGVPSLSPDGKTLLADSAGSLYVIGVDGSSATPITQWSTFNATRGSWSPDGSWIVFSLAAPNHREWDVARMRPDGSGLVRITRNPAAELFADWAP